MIRPTVSYKCHRFPPAVIAQAVWLYFRFPLSLRLVKEMLPGEEIRTGPCRLLATRSSRPAENDQAVLTLIPDCDVKYEGYSNCQTDGGCPPPGLRGLVQIASRSGHVKALDQIFFGASAFQLFSSSS